MRRKPLASIIGVFRRKTVAPGSDDRLQLGVTYGLRVALATLELSYFQETLRR